MLYIILAVDWQLAIAALAAIPVMLVLTRAYQTKLRQRARSVKRLESSAMEVIQEVLGSLRVVKAFGQEEREHERFYGRAEDGVHSRVGLSVMEGFFGLLIGATIAGVSAIVLYIGALHVRSGVLTLGELLLVMGYLSQLYDPLKSASKRIGKMQSSLASAERAFQLLDEAPDVQERLDAFPLKRANGDIAFREVSFSYHPEAQVLNDVSFRVQPGQRLGIYGVTGAGKTTLISLLTRLFDPHRGEITLDGVDIRDYKVAELRNQFAVVLQEPVLFSTTIAENIAYARPGATFEEVVEAARAAGAHNFIESLPDGYDTIVGERGMRLSGGERQRVALARAFLKDAPILVLDEPTSSVDHETEAAIVAAMKQLMAGRTTIMIAHRLSTLDECDSWLELLPGGTTRVRNEPPSGARRRAEGPLARLGPVGHTPELKRMPDRNAALGERDIAQHPAACAWTQLGPERIEVEQIEPLRLARKSSVYRLRGVGANGSNVIAKRCLAEGALTERTIYQEVLTCLPLPALHCYGVVEDNDPDFRWLFIDDAGTQAYDPGIPEHRAVVATWLAALHSVRVEERVSQGLPDRGPDHYLKVLRSARSGLREHLTNPFLKASDVSVLQAVIAQCDFLEAHWRAVEERCQTIPRVLVHGDLASKNVRVRPTANGLAFLAFDWENSGWGIPAEDLAWFPRHTVNPDLTVYSTRMNNKNPSAVHDLAACGKVFRLLDSIQWMSLSLIPNAHDAWLSKPISSLQVYRIRLAEAFAERHWSFNHA
jgi:ABC-type transport system involved in Fe-S cluster assembly fused permease/ATPase subunit